MRLWHTRPQNYIHENFVSKKLLRLNNESKMAWWGRVPAINPDNLSGITWTYMVGGENLACA